MNAYGHLYQITNKINNKVYIGQTKNIKDRFVSHRNNLKANRHKNVHLQSAWNKYGEEAFEFKILFTANSQEELDYYENCLIWLVGGVDSKHNYNKTTGGNTFFNHSEETKKIIGKHSRGENNPSAKLTKEDVLEIRRLADTGIDGVTIGKMFGISKVHVCLIKQRKKWAHT